MRRWPFSVEHVGPCSFAALIGHVDRWLMTAAGSRRLQEHVAHALLAIWLASDLSAQ